MAEVLRTDDVNQADRFAQWRHWISATLVPLECAPVSRDPFRGDLHKLFHDQGTSVARWVRERRLANCRRDLEDPALAQRGVHAIARRWGFEDPAHFQQGLQGQLRRTARRLPPARPPGLPPPTDRVAITVHHPPMGHIDHGQRRLFLRNVRYGG